MNEGEDIYKRTILGGHRPHLQRGTLPIHPYLSDVVIATKVGIRHGPDKSWQPHARPEDLRAAVEGYLERLGLGCLDLVYLRMGDGQTLVDSGVPLAESFGTLAELKEEGEIRHLGLSSIAVEQLHKATAVFRSTEPRLRSRNERTTQLRPQP